MSLFSLEFAPERTRLVNLPSCALCLEQICRYLFGLLTHRAFRDDNFCAQKYGEDWEKYKQKVPYMIIPGIF